MNASPIALLFLLQLTANPKVAAPPYPPLAFRGGTVVAVIEGKAKGAISILHAEEPFVDPVREALKQWQFSGEDKNRDALVVVNFRDFIVPLTRSVDCPQTKRHLPVPTSVTDPVYPENIIRLEGSVVVRMTVSATGNVKSVSVIRGVPEFNQCVIAAVQQWKFKPARDRMNKAMESEAYAVCVWRPLTSRSRAE